jgi:hypothetical protein
VARSARDLPASPPMSGTVELSSARLKNYIGFLQKYLVLVVIDANALPFSFSFYFSYSFKIRGNSFSAALASM